ncbi:MAG: phosphate ABC transporter substrate-binding protein [bacterium]
MKKILALTAVLVVLASSAFAWNWPWVSSSGGDKLSMSGSTTVLPIAQKAAEVFMQNNPKADISVRGGGSGVGIAAITDNAVDIATSSRAMKNAEIVKARAKGVNPVGTTIAQDGLSVVVNSANSLTALTLSQVKDIYTGKIKKWSELGGSDEVIVVISRDSASGTFEVFNELALRGGKLTDTALMQLSNQEIATTVGKTPGAIGYVGLAFITNEMRVLKIDGVMPSEKTVKSGEYKLSRPLYMYTNGEPTGMAKEFIDFILSDEGQKLVKDVGYISIK